MEPLPPVKEVEYRCYVGKIFEELSGAEFITFAFETAKEFSSFRYEIAVRYRIQPNLLEFKVLGMTATRTMMPAFGTARSVLKLPMLPYGVYGVKVIKSDGTENLFSVEISKRGIQILPPVPRKRFLDLIVEKDAQMPHTKIASTISKTPPAPLIPRTIQKRQPPPPTPEELAILESLKSETPEERDAREEAELFGGGRKADKSEPKDLDAVDAKAAKPTPAPSKAAHKPEHHKEPAKPAAKSNHHDSKHETKPAAKPAAKTAAAKAAPAKHAAKHTPAKGKSPSKAAKTKTAATTVTRHAAKSTAKQAPAKKAAPSAKVAAKKPAKTGSAKTTKSPAHGKKPVARKR